MRRLQQRWQWRPAATASKCEQRRWRQQRRGRLLGQQRQRQRQQQLPQQQQQQQQQQQRQQRSGTASYTGDTEANISSMRRSISHQQQQLSLINTTGLQANLSHVMSCVFDTTAMPTSTDSKAARDAGWKPWGWYCECRNCPQLSYGNCSCSALDLWQFARVHHPCQFRLQSSSRGGSS